MAHQPRYAGCVERGGVIYVDCSASEAEDEEMKMQLPFERDVAACTCRHEVPLLRQLCPNGCHLVHTRGDQEHSPFPPTGAGADPIADPYKWAQQVGVGAADVPKAVRELRLALGTISRLATQARVQQLGASARDLGFCGHSSLWRPQWRDGDRLTMVEVKQHVDLTPSVLRPRPPPPPPPSALPACTPAAGGGGTSAAAGGAMRPSVDFRRQLEEGSRQWRKNKAQSRRLTEPGVVTFEYLVPGKCIMPVYDRQGNACDCRKPPQHGVPWCGSHRRQGEAAAAAGYVPPSSVAARGSGVSRSRERECTSTQTIRS